MSISNDSIDVISFCASKAWAISQLITANSENLEEGFSCNHKIIMDALWVITEMLEEIQNEISK